MLEWLGNTEFSSQVRSELWGWPLALTLHAFGTALSVGFILIVSLRVLGLFEMIPYASVRRMFPVIWLAILLQIGSGFVLFATKPVQYAADGAFILKAAFILLAIILTIYFQGVIKRQTPEWEAKGGSISSKMTMFVAATLIVWFGIVITGRLTGYLGSLDLNTLASLP